MSIDKTSEEQKAKIILVNKVKAGKYLSNKEMEKLKKFASENESKYDELFDYNPKGIVQKAEIIKKIKTGQELSEEEVEELAFESEYRGLFSNNLVEIVKKDKKRWTTNMTTILNIDNELYGIDWEEGLTEYQDNIFWRCNKPYKVKRVEKVITGVEYERVKE